MTHQTNTPGTIDVRRGIATQPHSTAATALADDHTPIRDTAHTDGVEQLLSFQLSRISGWLLAYAYGEYSKTVTVRTQALADVCALAAYCSALAPVPVRFDAAGDDIAARRLLDAFAFIAPSCNVSVNTGVTALSVVDASAPERDRLTVDMSERALLPSLATSNRGTAASLRRFIIEDTGRRRASILSNGTSASAIVVSVAEIAGDKWPAVAGWLKRPESMPSSDSKTPKGGA
ncbi:hypothetical protein [Bifidobacterium pullorum]|uniref:hypothetical protein n=1 Tax=Bifidobacterium pullorum TaxID=78448 RepID=UPI003A94AD00